MSLQTQDVMQTLRSSAESKSFFSKNGLQRAAINSTCANDTLSSTGQPLSTQMLSFTESDFSHDFSCIPVRTVTPAASPMDRVGSLEGGSQRDRKWNSAGPVSTDTSTEEEEGEEVEEGEEAEEGEESGKETAGAAEKASNTSNAHENEDWQLAASAPTPQSTPAAQPAGGGRRIRARKRAAAKRLGIRSLPKLWFFDGERPASYAVSATVSTNTMGGMFSWSVSPKLTLSSAAAATPTVTTNAASKDRGDSWIRVQHTDADGTINVATKRLTIRAPDSLRHLRDDDYVDATYVYKSWIHYQILDQFGKTLPRSVPVNEQWTSGVTADYLGMNWERQEPPGSEIEDPNDWADEIGGERAGYVVPTPVAPRTAKAELWVCHWSGDWRVGSLTPGSGRLVASVVWQKNRGNARHRGPSIR